MAGNKRQPQFIPYWPKLLQCIEYGLKGDVQTVRGVAEVILQNLREDGNEVAAGALQRLLHDEQTRKAEDRPDARA